MAAPRRFQRYNYGETAAPCMAALHLSSPAFADGGEMPRRHGYKNGNVRPALDIAGVPDGCRSLALVLDDPDALKPAGKVWVHWAVWNIPSDAGRIGEAGLPTGAIEGATDFGEAAYGGPAPPDGRHTYFFRLYALDTRLELAPGSARASLGSAMAGHVIEEAVMTGTYAP